MKNEIEIKFKIEKADDVRIKLLNLGGVPKKPYEQTTYGFFSDDSMEKGIFPRIRDEYGKIALTVKVRPQKRQNILKEKNIQWKYQMLKMELIL